MLNLSNKQKLHVIREGLLRNFWTFVMFMAVKRKGKLLIPDHPLYREFCENISHLVMNTLILLPRKHLKTLIVSLFIIWYMMGNPANSITVICENKNKAKKLLRGIKNLMNLPHFKAVFGSDLIAKSDNDAYNIKLANRDKYTTAKEVNVETYGVEMDLQSARGDLMLWEDVVGKTFIKSQANRDMIFEAWEHADDILENDSKIVVTGTRYLKDDLYEYIINENDRLNNWNIVKYGIYDNTFEDTGVLCEAVFSKKEADYKRAKKSASHFACQYLNSPIVSENCVFDIQKYNYYENEWNKLGITELCFAIDPSSNQGEGKGDYSTISVCGKTPDNKFYLLDMYYTKNTRDLYNNCVRLANIYHPKHIFIEGISGFKLIFDQFVEYTRQDGTFLDFFLVKHQNAPKEMRIEETLEPLLRSQTLSMPKHANKHIEHLFEEMAYFDKTNKNNHDDGLDAFELCIRKLKSIKTAVIKNYVGNKTSSFSL